MVTLEDDILRNQRHILVLFDLSPPYKLVLVVANVRIFSSRFFRLGQKLKVVGGCSTVHMYAYNVFFK
jgi:hypothetical protein